VDYASMALLVIVALLVCLRRLLVVFSIITPFALVLVIILAIYATMTADTTGVEIDAIARTQEQLASPDGLLSAALHVSFNVAITVSIMAIVGATEKNYQAAKRGAVLGGIILGII